jgi:UDP-N-acetylmuramate dehydrogenase
VGDRIESVRVVQAGVGAVEIPRAEIPYRYRASGLPAGAVVTRATFGLDPGDSFAIRRRILWYLVQRRAKQPVEHRSAGSVFRNPPEDNAGRLVQMVGLKGSRVGQAMISEKHANFIVNLGGARAADVLALVDLMQARVREASGIQLELELQVVGVDEAESAARKGPWGPTPGP